MNENKNPKINKQKKISVNSNLFAASFEILNLKKTVTLLFTFLLLLQSWNNNKKTTL